MGYHVKFEMLVRTDEVKDLDVLDIYRRIDDDEEHCFSITRVVDEFTRTNYFRITNETWNSGFGSKRYPGETEMAVLRNKGLKFNYVAIGEDDCRIFHEQKIRHKKMNYNSYEDFPWEIR